MFPRKKSSFKDFPRESYQQNIKYSTIILQIWASRSAPLICSSLYYLCSVNWRSRCEFEWFSYQLNSCSISCSWTLGLLLDGDYRGLFALLISSFLNIFPFLLTTTKLIGDFLNKRVYFLFFCRVMRHYYWRPEYTSSVCKGRNKNSKLSESLISKIRSASHNYAFILLYILLALYLHLYLSSFPSPSPSSLASPSLSISPSRSPSPFYFQFIWNKDDNRRNRCTSQIVLELVC